MKLKCITDNITEIKGFLRKRKEVIKVEGITIGKIYSGTIYLDVSGSINGGFGNVSTESHFLIYNDNKEWAFYDMELFIPYESKEKRK